MLCRGFKPATKHVKVALKYSSINFFSLFCEPRMISKFWVIFVFSKTPMFKWIGIFTYKTNNLQYD